MKKIYLKAAVALTLLAMMPLQSCIGSFALTHKVLNWNDQVGSKFLNELVFFAFWILPVYEVTAVADLLVINSIEFWSGSNPVEEAYTKTIETENGTYIVKADATGYTIENPDGLTTRLEFSTDDQTWNFVASDGESYPFMTMLDESHVKMIGPDGYFHDIELSEAGLMAYREMAEINILAL